MILFFATFSCFFSFFLKAFLFLFFLERKGSKRKSSAEQLLFAAVVFFANMLHKTDGSNANRPFFRSMQDTRESVFSQINQLSRSVFCFFSSRKEIVLHSFLSRKKRKQKKVICGTVVSLRFRRFRQRAAQNGRFTYEPSVFSFHAGRAGNRFFSERPLSPAVSFVSFLQEKKSSPLFKKKRKEIVPLSEEKNHPSITSTARRGSRQQPSCPRPLRGSRSQRRSQRLRPHTRTACSSCRSPHRQ